MVNENSSNKNYPGWIMFEIIKGVRVNILSQIFTLEMKLKN